jgi:hypothetical protein
MARARAINFIVNFIKKPLVMGIPPIGGGQRSEFPVLYSVVCSDSVCPIHEREERQDFEKEKMYGQAVCFMV